MSIAITIIPMTTNSNNQIYIISVRLPSKDIDIIFHDINVVIMIIRKSVAVDYSTTNSY